MKSLRLSGSGQSIPTVGLGTWQAGPEEVERAVGTALRLGYRHLDTAFNYNNEEAIGNAVRQFLQGGGGERDQLFITTKLPHIANRAADVRRFVELQLKRLQLDYVDLYLIHVPFGFVCDPETLAPLQRENGDYVLDDQTDHIATWEALEQCHQAGLVKNIGLSNFNEEQIQKIIDKCSVKPSVLQVEMHGYFQQRELREFCHKHDITVTAYSPLGSPGAKDHFVNKYNYSPDTFPDLIGHPEVKEIANVHKKTAAQVLLRFLVDEQVVVIPKSTSEARLKENIDIFDFELQPEEADKLRNLDKGQDGRIFNFLFWKGVEKHPEYPFKNIL